eukprot:COSAG02_NODE_1653_length_11488_cov_66.480815_4_plen_155_part_00
MLCQCKLLAVWGRWVVCNFGWVQYVRFEPLWRSPWSTRVINSVVHSACLHLRKHTLRGFVIGTALVSSPIARALLDRLARPLAVYIISEEDRQLSLYIYLSLITATLPYKSLPASHTNHYQLSHTNHCQPLGSRLVATDLCGAYWGNSTDTKLI